MKYHTGDKQFNAAPMKSEQQRFIWQKRKSSIVFLPWVLKKIQKNRAVACETLNNET